MREIKFREWDEEHGYEQWDSLACPSYSIPEVFCQGRILEQYTGLKDSQDKEIYEGDKLDHEDLGPLRVFWYQPETGFMYEDEHGNFDQFTDAVATLCMVTGNIH